MKCQKFNHFSSVCKSKDTPNSKKGQEQKHDHRPPENPTHKRRVRRTIEEDEEEEKGAGDSTSSDDEFFCQAVRHLKKVKKIKTDGQDRTVSMRIENVDVRAELDNGAEVNVMDEHQFKALTNRSNVKPTLQPRRVKLSTLQSGLPVKGEFTATIRNQTCGAVARFVVVRGRINSPPPPKKKSTLQGFGMVQIREDGSFAETNDLRIHEEPPGIKSVKQLKDLKPEIKEITDQYSDVFKGIGKIRDIKNGKEFCAKFSMRPEPVPVAQRPRPVAYYLQEPLKKWLRQCVEGEIFEEVPEGEAVTWCSPLVVQPKPKFNSVDKEELEPHMISVDLRIPNQFMEKHRIT